jgi:glycerophosphoryl diester phosphodiesterase
MSDLAVPRLIGHRGAKATAPENTLASIRQAKAEGVDWVEFDVKLTVDGQPILMHDETLDRTTGGRGKVTETTLADIQLLDAGSWFGKPFAGERVPTLAAALDLMAELDMGFNLEVKPCPGREAETARVALAVLAARWPTRRPQPIISSFKAESLRAARRAAPQFPLGYLAETLPPDWPSQVAALGCRAVHPSYRQLDRDLIHAVKAAGYKLLVWTVNDVDLGRSLLADGVDSIITDRPGALVAGLLQPA